MPRVLLFLLAFVCLSVGFARADDKDEKKLSDQLKSTVDKLVPDDLFPADSKMRDRLKKAQDQLDKTETTLDVLFKKNPPNKDKDEAQEYLENVKGLGEALALVRDLKADLTKEKRVELTEAINRDFKLKSEFGEKNPKLAFVAAVEVTVRTKDGVKEVPGYEVRYVVSAWNGVEKRYKSFEQNSSPTTRKLPPGEYWMWARKDKKDGEKRKVSLGENGELKGSVDLTVP